MFKDTPTPQPSLSPKAHLHKGILLILCSMLLLFLCTGKVFAAEKQPEECPMLQNPAWQSLEELYPQMPLSWGKRYQELKAIAQEVDILHNIVPPLLVQLRKVTNQAQASVIPLFLDLVPTQVSVHECNYIVNRLQQWHWKLQDPLQNSSSVLISLNHYLTLLDDIFQATEEARVSPAKRPVVEQALQHFSLLHTLVHRDANDLRMQLHSLRSVSKSLFSQIDTSIQTAEKNFLSQWIDYYTSPLFLTRGAFSRLWEDIQGMFFSLSQDYFDDTNFALLYNIFVIVGLACAHIFMRQLSTQPATTGKYVFLHNLALTFGSFSTWRRLTLIFAALATLNSLVNFLPQFHVYIPFIYGQHIILAWGLALWASSSPKAPRVWEQALPITVGLILLHGNGSPTLLLLCLGGTILGALLSLIQSCRAHPSSSRFVWMGVLITGLLMTSLGFGRLAVPLFMLYVAVAASVNIVQNIKNHPNLASHPFMRPIFILFLNISLVIMCTAFLLSCSGFEYLFFYWQHTPLSFWNAKIYFSDIALILVLVFIVFFLSKLANNSLRSLSRRRRVLDPSAVPVLNSMIKCVLWVLFGLFFLRFLGMDITSLAFIGGGLTVGVGIASKTILSNFFCGLVIIFSRAVRAGDLVELNNVLGRVQNVNMRATVVETLSSGILLIPNEDMLNHRLTNWTLNNNHVREDLPIGVVCESSVEAVLEALRDAATDQPGILASPPPKALLVGFGDCSMNFVLQVWVEDVSQRSSTLSVLRQRVCSIFEQRGVELSSPRLEVSLEQDAKATGVP